MNIVLEFINRRFTTNCNWKSGNCYYFALILQDRFNGTMYYDVAYGHFVCKIGDNFYDYEGVYTPNEKNYLIQWSEFEKYDKLQYKRIVEDVLK